MKRLKVDKYQWIRKECFGGKCDEALKEADSLLRNCTYTASTGGGVCPPCADIQGSVRKRF